MCLFVCRYNGLANGFGTGFCGTNSRHTHVHSIDSVSFGVSTSLASIASLSTVSTFVCELTDKLARGTAYRYALLSIVLAQVLLLLVIGPYVWTQTLSLC